MFRILLYSEYDLEDDGGCEWHDSGEGPWDTLTGAAEFARNECGVAWVVVDERSQPYCFGSAGQYFGVLA